MVLAISAGVSARRQERMVSEWQPINYDVALTLDDKLSEITKARVVISLQVLKENLSSIDLDFGDMSLDAVVLRWPCRQIRERTPGLISVQVNQCRENQ